MMPHIPQPNFNFTQMKTHEKEEQSGHKFVGKSSAKDSTHFGLPVSACPLCFLIEWSWLSFRTRQHESFDKDSNCRAANMNEPGQQQQQQQQQHRWLPPPPLQPTAPPGTTATATAAVPVRRQQQQQQQQILRHNDSYGYNTTLQEKKSVTFLQDDDHFHRPRQLILVRSNSSKDCSECSRLEFKANRDMIVSDKTFGPLGPPPR